MGFKDLFIKDENSENKPSEAVKQTSTTTKFPTADEAPKSATPFTFPQGDGQQTFTPKPISDIAAGTSSEHLTKAIEVYQSGFDSLNQPGFDFYEFFQSVSHGGMDNPQIYQMAFQMASGMDKTITKDKLVQQADYYLHEIEKVYQDYVTKGNGKKQEIETQKTHENQSLVEELQSMKEQMESLRIQIEDRTNKLNAIGSKYDPQISEINSKLAANTQAKDTIKNSIEKVKQGINNNVK